MKTKLLFGFIFFLAIYSCSVKKNTFLSRKYHAVKTQYNVLFNGQQAFEKGLKEITENYKDNFWKRLPIEPITFKDSEISAPKFKSVNQNTEKQKNETPFDKAEEKARKAIETHSMNIKGYEKNSKIDDAFILLGKARYYTQRFIPAIDAYNYVLANYPNADLNYESRIWRAKSNIRLGNEQIAIEAMMLLLKIVDSTEQVPPRIKEQAHTVMAMAYTETDTIQKVIEHLTKATETFYNKEQSARNLFVLGQVYNELNRKDSAQAVFTKLAKTGKAPNKYRVHAIIELAKNAKKDSLNTSLIKRFKKLIRNSDNRKYYDELYYQLGTLHEKNGDSKKAIEYYKKSLDSKNGDPYQKTYTYESLADIYFRKNDYLSAGTYYDSVVKIVPKAYENEKRIRRIKKKNKGLIQLKKYEDIVKNNDSILKLVKMSKDEQTSFFNKHIEKIKEEDEKRRQQLKNATNFGGVFQGEGSFFKSNNSKWYFYNTQSKQFGEAEFKKIWGTRPLADNWRLSNKTSLENDSIQTENLKKNKIDSKYKLATYLNAIPTDSKKINDLKKQRNDALYKLGLFYKERFKNNGLAIKNLEKLEIVNTNKDIELPINYHLYQLYSVTKNKKATEKKEFILKNYPFSVFADIINAPEKKIKTSQKEDSVVKTYEELYRLYKKEQYQEVVNKIDEYTTTVKNSELLPKFILLKALCIGKYKSKSDYLKSLEFITFNYPNTEQAKKARQIIKLLKN